MADYPNSDEEFELMYEDELELLKEQDDYEQPVHKSRKSLEFSSIPANAVTHSDDKTSKENLVTNNTVADASNDLNSSFEADFLPIQSSQENETPERANAENTKASKRTIEELFGDIDDILSEGTAGNYLPVSKKVKIDKRSVDLALIDRIVNLRKTSRQQVLTGAFGKDYTNKIDRDKHNLSYRVPKFPFIGVTRHDGERVYVRFHSEEYEMDEMRSVANKCSFSGVMGESFKSIWKEAETLINGKLQAVEEEFQNPDISILETATDENKSLWVDLYKPKKYLELLSDESTNRALLKWIKLWDKVVFNRRPKIKPVKVEENSKDKFKFKKQELSLNLDEDGRPQYKVALLCGPPGLGKTTLAHMAAKHAGYNVVEVNASDDRSTENFKTALENATSMRSVLDRERRPNCLIFDEIDGAPPTSIDFLIQFVNGTRVAKSKKDKNRKAGVLKRPIICICNDVYVPALRSLRQMAFVVNFPHTTSARLAERLNEIARRQQIKTDMGALLALAEKSHNDIRSCLSVLHFFKSQNKPTVTLSDVLKSDVGQKDMQKGLFAVWNDIFQIERPKHKAGHVVNGGNQLENDKRQYTDVSLTSRMRKVLHSVNSFGDYERLMQGVFENYPSMNIKDSSMVGTCEAVEWFCFNDMLNKKILSHQEYSLLTYLQFGFVMWHFMFASSSWQKITYPSAGYEVRTKTVKQRALTTELIKGMQPSVRTYVHSASLSLEILPYLIQIIVPSFRPVNLHLYTQEEKEKLIHVVSVMIDYNLNYVQERTPDGTYVFNFDPNIEELTLFSGTKPKRSLTYSNRQMITREIELEKMRRIESRKVTTEEIARAKAIDTVKKDKELPNHLQRLKAKSVKSKESVERKDFFGRTVTVPVTESNATGPELKNDIWYQYKEGYTNAVRKKIIIKDLL